MGRINLEIPDEVHKKIRHDKITMNKEMPDIIVDILVKHYAGK